MTPEEYQIQRRIEVEKLAKEKFAKLISISPDLLIEVEADKNKKAQIYEQFELTTKKTPDFIAIDGTERSASSLMFLEVNEPQGGLMKAYGVDKLVERAMINAPLSDGMDGNYSRVIINPPSSPINREVTNKIKNTYKKYSFNRTAGIEPSLNTGLIYCMGDTQHEVIEKYSNFISMSHTQFFTLLGEACLTLSGRKKGFQELHSCKKKVFAIDFCDEYKFMGFVTFIGGHSAEGYNYIVANKRFLKAKANFVSKRLAKLSTTNGRLECY